MRRSWRGMMTLGALAMMVGGCGDDGPTTVDASRADGGSMDGSARDASFDSGHDAHVAVDSGPVGPQRCDVEVDLGMETGEPVATGSTVDGDNDVTPSCSSPSAAPDTVYRWQAPSAGTWVIDTLGSRMDTVLHVRTSDCTEVACSEDVGETLHSRVDVDVDAGDELLIAVDGFGTNRGEFVLNISQPPVMETDCFDGVDNDRNGLADCVDAVCDTLPECTETDCSDGIDNDGDRATDCGDLDCIFAGVEPCVEVTCDDMVDNDMNGLTDCEDFECAGREPCSETVCDDEDDGDGDGSTDCDDADCGCDPACREPTPCPSFDLGMSLGSSVANGSTAVGCDERPSPECLSFGSGPEATFSWTAPESGDYTFDTLGSDFDTALYVRYAACDGVILACNDDTFGTEIRSTVTVPLSAGQTAIIVIEGSLRGVSGIDRGNYQLNVTQR